METERRIQDLESRTKMWEALKTFDADSDEVFAIMDSSTREAAQEKRKNVEITKKLAEIAAEYDRKCNAPPPPPPTAEELAPLNQLAELAVKPALLSQRSRLSSTMPGYSDRSPRQPPPSSLPSQHEHSAGTVPPHPPSSFLQVAMEPSIKPPHNFRQSPAPSLPSMGMRQPESSFNPLSSSVGRGADGRPPLAAKPAVYGSSERFAPNNPNQGHTSNHQILPNMAPADHTHHDRARLPAEHATRESRTVGRHSLSAVIGQTGNDAEQAHAEAVCTLTKRLQAKTSD